MYWIFEYATVVALVALVAALLFTVSVVLILAGEGIRAVLRISRETVLTRTAEEARITS